MVVFLELRSYFSLPMNSKYTKHMDQEHIVKIVSDLIAINTVNPPGNEHLVLPIVKPLMEDLGMEVMTYEKESGRTNIVGKLGSGGKSVAFISHMDTVPPGDRELWDTDPFTPVVKDGKIFGRGALDDKGSFAACYSACKAFIAENPNFGGTIYLVAAADEELGSRLGVIYLMQDENFRVDACIIPDGGEMDQAVLGEKGILHLDVVSYGKQAHGSLPMLGKNAIEPLAALVSELKHINLGEDYDKQFDGWTMNVGVIQGGIAANVVPARATLSIDFRFPTGITKEDIIAQVQEKIDLVKQRDPLARFEIKEALSTKPHMITADEPIVKSFEAART